MMSTVPQGKIRSTNFQEHLNCIDPSITSTIELPGTDGVPFLDNLTKNTSNPLNLQSTENPPTQIGT